MREFNFKMFHNILSCGEILHKWEIKQGNLCHDCNGNIHTVKHMLFECVEIISLWNKIGAFLNIEITYEKIITGYPNNDLVNSVVSFVCFSIYLRFSNEIQSSILFFIKRHLNITRTLYNYNEELLPLSNSMLELAQFL